jgi:hypothetical protein
LGEGRLFRLEPDPAFDSRAEFDHSIEYFWLFSKVREQAKGALEAAGPFCAPVHMSVAGL